MKTYVQIIAVVIMVTGGVFMANHYGGCDSINYKEYSSQDSEINIAMDYISDWEFSEHRGSYGRYAQVQFYGKVKNEFAPSFIVTVERGSKVSFKPLTIQALAEDLIGKRMKLEGTEVLSRSETELLGLPAVDMTLAYQKLDKLRDLEAKLVPFQERVVVFQKDDKFYTVRYVNPQQEFASFEQDFLHCIKTLRIKE